MKQRMRYQQGSLTREARKACPHVWIFRYREGQINRKIVVGTVERYRSKAAAWKACEQLRLTINRGTTSPRTLAELVTHYAQHELPKKTPYTAEVYAGYAKASHTIPKAALAMAKAIPSSNLSLRTSPLR
jgi:hypothetical protein